MSVLNNPISQCKNVANGYVLGQNLKDIVRYSHFVKDNENLDIYHIVYDVDHECVSDLVFIGVFYYACTCQD